MTLHDWSRTGFALLLMQCGLARVPQEPVAQERTVEEDSSVQAARAAASWLGLELTPSELVLVAEALKEQLGSVRDLHRPLPNSVVPALVFDPLVPPLVARMRRPAPEEVPTSFEGRPWDGELRFASIDDLGRWLREGRITCLELCDWALAELERVDATLECVITLLPERARAQARLRDEELAAGIDRGPLHGIPWGAKDLLAVSGAPTTWGAAPFRGQTFERDALVVERLDAAGAVLVAKLTLGALAMGDRWFGGTTRNPWNPERGSSGSSAGSAAAVAAGALPFAIGSETLGSIVSPCTRCSVTGLRPTFGRVPRDGAMALSWTMDKLGPIARTVRGTSLVLEAMAGAGGGDPATVDLELPTMASLAVQPVRIGVPSGAFPEEGPWAETLEELRALGHELIPIEVPEAPLEGMLLTLMAEAAAAFDELTRSDQDDELVAQSPRDWAALFRAARFIPAVEYVNAQRHRTLLCRAMAQVFDEVDLVVHPPYAARLLTITNLTGHPTIVAPVAAREAGQQPRTICFTGRLYDEAQLASVVDAWQRSTGHHLAHPDTRYPSASGQESSK